jgi:fatty acid amide hydrolase
VPWRDPAAVAVAGLRVAAYSDDGYFSASPAIRRAVDVASAALRDRGATVEPWTPPDVPSAVQLLFGIVGADGGRWARRAVEASERDPRIASLTRLAGLRPSTRAALSGVLVAARQGRLASTLRSTGSRPAAEYWELVEARNRYRSAFIERLDAGRFDAIICPPHALPALTHGASKYLLTAASYALLFNLLGMPAGVAPVTRVMPGEESDRRRSLDIVDRAARDVERHSTGLPVGVQVVARHWREDLVLAIMAAIEAAVRPRPDFPARPPL